GGAVLDGHARNGNGADRCGYFSFGVVACRAPRGQEVFRYAECRRWEREAPTAASGTATPGLAPTRVEAGRCGERLALLVIHRLRVPSIARRTTAVDDRQAARPACVARLHDGCPAAQCRRRRGLAPRPGSTAVSVGGGSQRRVRAWRL